MMSISLRKYKKNELIDLLLEYEEEINNLKIQLTTMQLDIQVREQEKELHKMESLRDKVVNKKVEYLVKRIRVINDPMRKIIYINELNRINALNDIIV